MNRGPTMNSFFRKMLASAALIASWAAAAQEPAATAPNRTQAASCAGCHGTHGQGAGAMPALAGLPRDHLARCCANLVRANGPRA